MKKPNYKYGNIAEGNQGAAEKSKKI